MIDSNEKYVTEVIDENNEIKITNEKQNESNVLNVSLHFPTFIYTIEKPEFLDAVKKIADEALDEIKKEQTLNEIYPAYMTGNLFDKTDILPFQFYVGQTAANILDNQGYNLQGFETFYSEMWCQEHYKHSAMEQHVHGFGSQLIGFYFLECPENCSRVVFHDPRSAKQQVSWTEKDMSQVTAASNMINFVPTPGLLMITNAWLPHSFTRHAAETPMKFIHFNIGLRPLINFQMPEQCVAPQAEIV